MTLLKETKLWRVDSEKEAISLINTLKEESLENAYDIIKSGYQIKTKKSKGEIIDSWAEVTATFSYVGE